MMENAVELKKHCRLWLDERRAMHANIMALKEKAGLGAMLLLGPR